MKKRKPPEYDILGAVRAVNNRVPAQDAIKVFHLTKAQADDLHEHLAARDRLACDHRQQEQAAEAQPDRQVVIVEIQPVGKRIDQRDKPGEDCQQQQQDSFGAGNALPGFHAGFGGLLVRITNHHLGDYAGPISELIEDRNGFK